MLFSNENISVRRMNDNFEDKYMLLEWLTNPTLLELVYGEDAPWDMQKIEDKFNYKTADNAKIVACFILHDEQEIGYTQFYKLDKNEYSFNDSVPFSKFEGGYGMDIFIGYPHLWGKEIGTKTVRAMVDYLMNTYNAKCVCADPYENNQRSVKCWLKAGFSSMGRIQNQDYPDKNSIFMAAFR